MAGWAGHEPTFHNTFQQGFARDGGRRSRRPGAAATASGRLFAKGMRPAEVARELGVSRQSATVWHRAWQEEGVRGLRHAERAGRPPVLLRAHFGFLLREGKVRRYKAGEVTHRGPLSRKTVANVLLMLRAALNDAVAADPPLVRRNVALDTYKYSRRMDRPETGSTAWRTLDLDAETVALLEAHVEAQEFRRRS